MQKCFMQSKPGHLKTEQTSKEGMLLPGLKASTEAFLKLTITLTVET